MGAGMIAELLHVLTAFWFVCGIVGRDLTFWQASWVSSVQEVRALLQVSDFF